MRACFFVLCVLLGLGVGGCSKKDSGSQESAAGKTGTESSDRMPTPEASTQPGSEAAPMATAQDIPVEGLFIKPFLDEAGTRSEISVKPGEQFTLYIFAETVDPYPTGGAQLRLQLPPGINVHYTSESAHKLSSFGKYDYNYMVAYECQEPGRFVLVSYLCEAMPDFRGGTVEVLPGFLADNESFLGFTTCEYVEIRATGGQAMIKLK